MRWHLVTPLPIRVIAYVLIMLLAWWLFGLGGFVVTVLILTAFAASV